MTSSVDKDGLSTENEPMLDTLVVVDRYPSEDDLYAYAFVHSRVKAYIKDGLKVKVFLLDEKPQQRTYSFEGVDVISGNGDHLRKTLEHTRTRTVSVHFLTPHIWSLIEDFALSIPTNVWIHGSEIQDWLRRHFAFNDKREALSAIRGYRTRHEFWRQLFEDVEHKLHFVFVSQYFADEVMEDLGVTIDPDNYSIIHNFIDTELFAYKKKDAEQRKNILTIRPFASAKYANDLTVKAILDLAKEEYFNQLSFTIAGDGDLFDEITKPIKHFDNVTLINKFLTQSEIAKLHVKNGVFINPTRMDAQGVSRDEAMSSGLVPVTSNNTAIPEFVSHEEGYIVATEDYKGLADSIRDLYSNPDVFLKKSSASAKRVRRQSGFKQTIQAEISLLSGKKPPRTDNEHVFRDYLTEKERVLRSAIADIIDDRNNNEIAELRNEILRIKDSGSYRLGLKLTGALRRLYNNRLLNVPARATLAAAKKVKSGKHLGPKNMARKKINKFILKSGQGSVKIATIVDDFTYEAFRYEAEITQLSKENWLSEIKTSGPDLLFVESAWRGVGDSWKDIIDKTPQELIELVEYCRKNSIPTVFWNKEDPMHTDRFMRTAELFDYVFTTDSNTIPKYVRELGHKRVFALPFAAQPRINNPIELYDRVDAVSFAGSYYAEFKDRNEDFSKLTENILQYKDLAIFDRNHDIATTDARRFPNKYQPYIKGSLPFDQIDKAYKGYRYAITINTVKDSPTMFARRAFELLLSNTITIGNYSLGVYKMLGELVFMPNSEGVFDKDRLSKIFKSSTAIRETRLLGVRAVLENHTYKQRLHRILGTVFDNYKVTSDDKKVSIIAHVLNDDQLTRTISYFDNQVYQHTNLVILLGYTPRDKSVILDGRDPGITVVNATRNAKLKTAQKSTIGDYIAVFNPEYYYGPHYIQDAIFATNYSDAKVIGRKSHYTARGKDLRLLNESDQYIANVGLRVHNSLVHRSLLSTDDVNSLLVFVESKKTYKNNTLSIDGFNYSDALIEDEATRRVIDGRVTNINTGLPIDVFYKSVDKQKRRKL